MNLFTENTSSRNLGAVLVVAALGLASSSASAQFSFDGAAGYGVGNRPSGVAAGDFDGDGDIDLATTVDDPDRIVILLNDGAGHYSLGASAPLGSSVSPSDLVAGDYDGDGDIDLAVALRDPSGRVLIMNNNGGGSFSMGQSINTGERPRGLDAADMDGDGDIDLAVANRDGNTASVLTNNGGSFTAATFSAGNEPRATTFLDIDLDGDLDLAVTVHDDRTIALYTNNGGSFSPAGNLSLPANVRPGGITSADFDGDGDSDLATAIDDQTFNINQVAIHINTGGGFSGPFAYNTGGQRPDKLVAADFDCDGAIDLAVTNQDSNTVALLQNIGGGAFGAPTTMSTGTRPGEITAFDADGDGDSDLAVANRDSNDVSVFMNQTCEPSGEVTLVDFAVTRGSHLGGGIAELGASDDAYLTTRSQIGFVLSEANLMEITIGFVTTGSPTSMDLLIESRISNTNGTARIRLMNWNTGQFEEVHSYGIDMAEQAVSVNGVAAANRVRAGDGRIELGIKHTVVATFTPLGFDSSLDETSISVQ